MKDLNKLIGVVLLAAILAVGGFFAIESQFFKLQKVEVISEEVSAGRYLFDKIRGDLTPYTANLTGQYIWDISIDDLLSKIRSDQRVAEASIQRQFPNKIAVKIRPFEPLLILLDKTGGLFPVAADGSLLPKLSLEESPDLPLLRGQNFSKNLKLRQRAIELIKAIPSEGFLNRQTVSEIHYDDKLGFELILTSGGEKIRLGQSEFSFRAGLVERVLTYLQSEGLRGRVIDARFSKKVVVRLRNEP